MESGVKETLGTGVVPAKGTPTLKSVIEISRENWAEFFQGKSNLPERSPLEVLYRTWEHVRSHVLMDHPCTGVYIL